MLRFLEVRIGEKEKHLLELSFVEEVRKVLHSIGAQDSNVGVLEWRVVLEGCYPVLHIIRHFHSDFQAQHQDFRK